MNHTPSLVTRLERSEGLRRWGGRLERLGRPLQHAGNARDLLSGTPIGHPAHPALVTVPLGMWLSAGLVDLAGARNAPVARRLIGAGVLSVVPALASGLSDWLDTDGAERNVGAAHAAANTAAAALQATSWLIRPRHRAGGIALSGVAMATGAFAGWLGGHLAYRAGVGVNLTAFQSGPQDWTPVIDADRLAAQGRHGLRIDGTAILVTAPFGDDRVPDAVESRCTHRGGPLNEGEISDGCVTCPWHGSVFSLRDGAVRRGPATISQPAYEVRVRAGRVELRREERGSLRVNPQAGERELPPLPAEQTGARPA